MRLSHKTFDTNIVRFYVLISKFVRFDEHFFGGNGEEATPVPISNTEVKLFSADGTAREAEWESRSLPKNFINPEPFWFRVFYFGTARLR